MQGRDVVDLTASERNVAMVFQSYALYPHMTVEQNIALPLVMREMSRLERLPGMARVLPRARAKHGDHVRRVREIAAMLNVSDLLARKPAALSGGEKQRVAVGRALVRDPSLFLLDEPLSNLDAKLRVEMRRELSALHARTGTTFVYVTHDQAEAMSMSDYVAVVLNGRIAQQGRPRELYEQPASRDVAEFVGAHPINLIDLRLGPQGRLAGLPVRCADQGHANRDVTLAIRPEHLSPDPAGGLTASVESVEYMGTELILHARLATGQAVRAIAAADATVPQQGDSIGLGFQPAKANLFDRDTGARLDVALRACQP
jgi:multiple sugar transport system ATP-binding protein